MKQSELVDNLLWQIRAAGLVEPELEVRFHPVRKWRFDLAYCGHRLAIEVDGGTWTHGRHTRGAGFEKDCEKGAEAVLAGWRVLHVTGGQIKSGQALTWLTRALTGADVQP